MHYIIVVVPKPSPEAINAQNARRVRDCDKYHMPFDGVARDFHDHLIERFEQRGTNVIDDVFDEIADAQRRHLVLEMYEGLDAQGKLEIMTRLTGNVAIQEFLRELAAKQTAYDEAMLKIEAEADEFELIQVANIPEGAVVDVYMCDIEQVNELNDAQEIAQLPYHRQISLRAVGNGRFKIISEDIADGFETEDEDFDVNDIVRIGAVERKGKTLKLEPSIQWQETFGVARGDQTYSLHLAGYRQTGPDIHLVTTLVKIDNDQILPSPED